MGSDPARAAELLRTVLRAEPHHLDAGLLLSEALRRHGDHGSARQVITPIAAANPRHFGAQRQLGIVLAGNGAALPAALALQAAASLNPNHPTIWRDLGEQLMRAGDAPASQRAYLQHALSGAMDPALAGPAAHLRAGDLEAASAGLLAYLEEHPTDITALRMLGEAQARSHAYGAAEQTMRRIIALAPAFHKTRHDLTLMLMGLGRIDEALIEARALLKIDPNNPGSRRALGAVLNSAGEYEEALSVYEKLAEDDPHRASIWTTLGHLHKTMGDSAKSVTAYRRSIDLTPHAGDAYWGLANLKTFRFSDADIAEIRRQLQAGASAGEDKVNLLYSLGKALEQRNDPTRAFEAYAEGAAIRSRLHPHDADTIQSFVDACIETHSSAFFESRRGSGHPAPDPIFVLGLPRSGSTLVEQILASHSEVEGTMELADLGLLSRDWGANYLDTLSAADASALRRLGESYLRSTARRRKLGRAHFIDKMPNNWMHIAMIQLTLPNARIIDARRHPMACGWSCFKQHFAMGQDFSYNLSDIGRYYADYVRLLAHYDAALPQRVHRVIHERLVRDPESEIRALLDYCGLPFEAQCLRPHETKRAVHTASAEQVRQPISPRGLEEWRVFEPQLAPLKSALGEVLDCYPEAPK